ncbi:OTU domain-containing protein 3-like [Mizuhopecten yessoensis]|uniref:OTU domain-containing protein 3 n=1 Tax=Mizuhopecten yessoensis TaxID=6573 RepID=A0A210PUY6_MIZYE|nr:OTU domain-containing protein 3-like [Mizuhopecten yessoensis]XP_021374623.1 OTU domain-containing protein 3-like [Mizuhopecten yessoensis]XP_021374625.1 OTU domain-containing protein 3-like [Mizuhopecten yessoensis]XP_021374626.1 OTU domain-containing protein 3-like [Mizuhopecten yessoensis]OWF40310.1 OTU domain-containing protein 3 [Mizuhopecten yessoensis]
MSARGVQYVYDPRMTKSQHYRQDVVSRKREERAVREHHKRERKVVSYLSDDGNFPSFKMQLSKIGLQLRDIPGDGNCLFRALGDQLEGHGRNHFKYRYDVVNFMSEHREDFEPFVEDDVPFDRHIQNLRKIGTYAGNDAIVAFARLQQVNVIIHQLSSPFLLIQGLSKPTPNARQIHIAYHNGDHYSSVRHLSDNTESQANLRLKVDCGSDKSGRPTMKINTSSAMKVQQEVRGQGVVSALRDEQSIEYEVMAATGCMDEGRVTETLMDCQYDVDLAISQLLQLMEMEGEQEYSSSGPSEVTSTDSGVSSETGMFTPIHSRDNSYGGSSGYGSLSSASGARPKTHSAKSIITISNKQKKEQKKLEKKKRAEERHKQRVLGINPTQPDSEDEGVVTVVSKDIAMMKI